MAERKNVNRKDDQFLTFKISNEWFGLPITTVQDVLYTPIITPVPLSDPEVAGLINLRGHIVTAIYMSKLLGISSHLSSKDKSMSIIIQDKSTKIEEFYGFMVDKVSDIENLDITLCEPLPSNMNEKWKNWAQNVYRLPNRLLIVLNHEKLIDRLLNTME